MDLAPSGFLGHAVFTIYFRTLRSEALPERLAKNPGECAGLLKKDMAEFVLLASHHVVTLSEAVARCNKYSRHNGKKQIRPARRTDSPALNTEGEAPALGVCINFFWGTFKDKESQNGEKI